MKLLSSVASLVLPQTSALFFQKEQHAESHIQTALLETAAELRQMMGGLAVDPAGDLLGTVSTMITDTMMPGIISAHNSTQQELDGFLATVNSCPSPVLSSGAVTLLQTRMMSESEVGDAAWISDKMEALLACRKREAKAATDDQDCQKDLKTLEGVKNGTCNALKNLETKPVPSHLCEPTDPYDEWLASAKKTTTELKKELTEGKHGCGNATQLYDDAVPKCVTTKGHYDGNKTECDRLQAEAEAGACSGPLATQQNACDDYSECYDNAIAAYNAKEPAIKALHQNWTVQWRVLKRMDCLLGIMATGGTNDDIDKCKAKLWPTDHLDLAYPNFPEKEKCPGAEQSGSIPLPCGEDFLRKYYGNNPDGAPAAACTPCPEPTTAAPTTLAPTTPAPVPYHDTIRGGAGGGGFSDFNSGFSGDIADICVWSGSMVDSIQINYWGKGHGGRHGGSGGGGSCIALAQGEYVNTVIIRYGGLIDALEVRTNTGQSKRWGGHGGGQVVIAPPGKRLISIAGRAGGMLDALGTIWL